MKNKHTNVLITNKDILRVFAITGAILMIPLVSMQFKSDADWSFFDFALMGVLLSSTGILIAIAARQVKSSTQRVFVILALLAAFFIIWAQLAVNVIEKTIVGFQCVWGRGISVDSVVSCRAEIRSQFGE